MKTIYKFKITNEITEIQAPIIKFLTAQVQKNQICVWAEVDTDLPSEDYILNVIGTGWPLNANENYIGTVQDFDGELIWHIYWRKK